MVSKNILDQFNKFAGKEVNVETTKGYTSLSSQNPVIDELKQAVKDAGLGLRLSFLGALQTCDYDTNRLNSTIIKGLDGKYRLSTFSIG